MPFCNLNSGVKTYKSLAVLVLKKQKKTQRRQYIKNSTKPYKNDTP